MAGAKLDSVKYTNMFKAYGAFWRRGFTEWAGTASRSEYWWNVLMNWLILIIGGLVMLFVAALAALLAPGGYGMWDAQQSWAIFCTVVAVAYVLLSLVPWISLTVRRLHDSGLSAIWLLILLSLLLFTIVFGSVMVVETSSPVIAGAFWMCASATMVLRTAFFVFSLLPTKVEDNPYHQFNK